MKALARQKNDILLSHQVAMKITSFHLDNMKLGKKVAVSEGELIPIQELAL